MARHDETHCRVSLQSQRGNGQAVEMERASVQSHIEDSIILPNGRRVPRRDVASYARALRLKLDNEHVFKKLVAHLRREVEAGRYIGADEVAAFLRSREFVDGEGGEFKLNHDYVPVWMREIREVCPDLAPHIKLRKSRFDVFYEA